MLTDRVDKSANPLRVLAAGGHEVTPKPRFGHAREVAVGPYQLLGCYHPSQQNTFTGRLTPEMVDDVLARACEVVGADGVHRP